MGWLDLGIGVRFSLLVLVLSFGWCGGETDERDVYAINSLYVALGTPEQLVGWQAQDGDPCGNNWEGVDCVYSNITALKLDNADLGGELGENLGLFSSIISIDLSGNHIGGPIPASLPPTIRMLNLSNNQFTGPIPDSLDTLSQLTDLSLSDNNLTGEIPDSFEPLNLLMTLELADNQLSGPLPPSMAQLSSLVELYMQNNQITGTLNVLQDLPQLAYLNVENNLLSGPIPPSLMDLKDFRSSGNPFNTTIIPSPPAMSPLPASPESSPGPASVLRPSKPDTGPSKPNINAPTKKTFSEKMVIWIVVAGLAVLVVIGMTVFLFMLKPWKRLQRTETLGKPPPTSPPKFPKRGVEYKETTLQKNNHLERAPKTLLVGKDVYQRTEEKHEHDIEKGVFLSPHRSEDHASQKIGTETDSKHRKPSLVPTHVSSHSAEMSPRKSFVNSVTSFSIAELQLYTRSFAQGNLIGKGSIGSVFRAKLPEGKALAVKKLNIAVTSRSDAEFHELVSVVSKWKHPNVVELAGYCAKHGQYLLAFEYYRNGTLYDALHLDDEVHSKLSWKRRMMIALGAAKGLEYLHETCQPPVIHRNFKSANLLLDDKLSVSVSDGGLSFIMSQEFQNQLCLTLSSNGYGAPELEAGSYTLKSDIYSFGVVMLELLTARKPFDRLRPRGEQFLVPWALSRLHDIDSLSRMVDPSLNGAYPSKSLSRFADIISLCLQPEPEFRPAMSEIVENIMYLVQK